MGHTITRQQLESSPTQMLSEGRNWTKGQVRLLEWQGRRLAVKDILSAHPLFRNSLGKWLIRREAGILKELQGIPEVPAIYCRIDRWAFAREYVQGEPLRIHRKGQVPKEVFRHLQEVIGQMHARGIAHGDLHHRNILLDGPGKLYLIDFSNSIRRGGRWNPIQQWIFRQWARIDRRAILKLKSRYRPEDLSPQEKEVLANHPFLYRLGKWFRRLLLPA